MKLFWRGMAVVIVAAVVMVLLGEIYRLASMGGFAGTIGCILGVLAIGSCVGLAFIGIAKFFKWLLSTKGF